MGAVTIAINRMQTWDACGLLDDVWRVKQLDDWMTRAAAVHDVDGKQRPPKTRDQATWLYMYPCSTFK